MYPRPKCKIQNISLPEDNTGENLGDCRFGDILDTTPKALSMKKN